MTVVENYKCDATGEVFEQSDSIEGYTLLVKRKNSYEFYNKTIHVSTEFLTDKCGQLYPNGSDVEYIGVNAKELEIDGMKGKFGIEQDNPVWYGREDVVLDHYQDFYTAIEVAVDNILY